MSRPTRIALSFCFDWADPQRPLFKGKTLAYYEESMLQWVMHHGALPCVLPRPYGEWTLPRLLEDVDGLLLAGGTDVSPGHYGEDPINDQRHGDPDRDAYEMESVSAALELGLPVLGVCRGLQVINVALGGSLWQDMSIQLEDRLNHRNWDVYEQNIHEIHVLPDSPLAKLYPSSGRVNSIHSQSVKRLGEGLTIEARATDDTVESISRIDDSHYIRGIQWHPEFHHLAEEHLLDPGILMQDFLKAIQERKRV